MKTLAKKYIPAGFRAYDPTGVDAQWPERHEWRKLGIVSDDGLVRVLWDKMPPVKAAKKNPWGAGTSGTTGFRTERGGTWYSFDRPGIDDSFYANTTDELLREIPVQVERAREGIERARAPHFQVPGLPYSLRQERKDALTKQLKERGTILLHPAGMGRAHSISTGRRVSRYATPGSQALCEYFGVKACWVETQDYD